MSFGAAFLAEPDRFPPAGQSEPWGEESLTLRCAGQSFPFHGLDAAQADALAEHFGDFVCDLKPEGKGAAPVVSRLYRASPDAFHHPPTRGWELWMDFAYGPTEVRAASLRLLSRLTWTAGRTPDLGGALWTSVAGGSEFLGVVENHLRLLVAYHLLAVGGVLLHSSGVLDRDSSGEVAHLFLGPSGAGKTTVARHSREQGRAVLSDDMNAVLLAAEGERPKVCRVPFAGDPTLTDPTLAPGHRAPLATLARLRQGETSRLRPVSPSTALAVLTACTPFVNRDPHRQGALLDNLTALLRTVPLVELEFPRAGGFWSLLSS